MAGAAASQVEQPTYFVEIEQIRRAEADTILILLSAVDQIPFLGGMDTACLDVAAFTFPNSIAQTRDYVEATRAMAPDNNSDFRFQLWETTLESDGANDFNLRYTSRWSEAADPTGWAAYHAVKILLETVLAVGTTDSDAIISYLESPETTFDLLKGPGTYLVPSLGSPVAPAALCGARRPGCGVDPLAVGRADRNRPI